MHSYFIKRTGIVLLAGILSAFLLNLGTSEAANNPEIQYANDLLTIKAEKISLISLLKRISEVTGVDILVSEDFASVDISIHIENQPLDESFKRLLRGYNNAAVYMKAGKTWKISAIKVYPEGKYDGGLIAVRTGKSASPDVKSVGETKTVYISSTGEVMRFGEFRNHGILVPPHSMPKASDGQSLPEWFGLQQQLERDEIERYRELTLLKRKLEATQDPEKKKALAMVYADEAEKFYALKKANLNKIEAIKRIYQSGEIKKH